MHYVFNTEGENEILGRYVRQDEDAVVYEKPGSAACDSYDFGYAPADCVAVRDVTRSEIVAEIRRLQGNIERAIDFVGGDSLTAMNTLVALGIEMVEYAQVMGARLTVDAAYHELRRNVNHERHYRGARAHSQQFEVGDPDGRVTVADAERLRADLP